MLRPQWFPRTWFRLLAAGPIVLLLAIAPAFLYVDHWDDMATYAVYGSFDLGPSTVSPEHGTHASHQGHCHVGPASCADQPAPVSSVVAGRVIELPSPHLSAVALEESTSRLEEVTIAPPSEPPRL